MLCVCVHVCVYDVCVYDVCVCVCMQNMDMLSIGLEEIP